MVDDGRRVTSLAAAARKYTTILADPPWDYRGNGRRGGHDGPFYNWRGPINRQNTGPRRYSTNAAPPPAYKTMPLERIKALPVDQLAAKDAHLYLWATDATMPEAYDVVRAWGFKPWTVLHWVKHQLPTPRFRTAHGPRSQTESVIVARRGHAPFRGPVVSNVIDAGRPRRGHSSKPTEFYDLIEGMAPPGPRLELFARGRRAGWDAYGRQATNRARNPKGATAVRLRNISSTSPYSVEIGPNGVCHECGRNAVGRCDVIRRGEVVGDYGYCREHRAIVQRDCKRAPNPRAAARPKKFTAFCEQCYSASHSTDSIRDAERWATSHMRMYGHRVAINRNTATNPGKAARAARALARGQERWRARGERWLIRGRREAIRAGRTVRGGRFEQTYAAEQRRRRRRNPSEGDWIDLLVPAVIVALLLRGGILKPAA